MINGTDFLTDALQTRKDPRIGNENKHCEFYCSIRSKVFWQRFQKVIDKF